MNWEIYLFFFQAVILCFMWTAPDKTVSIIALVNADSWFIPEYHFHPTFKNKMLIFFKIKDIKILLFLVEDYSVKKNIIWYYQSLQYWDTATKNLNI